MQTVKLGQLTVNKVFENEDALPFSMVMPDIGADDLRKLLAWHRDDHLTEDPATSLFCLSIHSYLLQVDGMNILIDSCNGNHKTRTIPLAHMLDKPWLANLAAHGLAPENIDMVMCTHLHADHVGWNTRLDNGRWVPTFPNARYLFGRRDYEFFSTQEHEIFHHEAYLDSVLPVVKAGLADIVDEDIVVHREIGDGIWLTPAFGHSPGSLLIHAESGGAPALFSGDIIHHPIQLVRPDLPIFADEDPIAACAMRQRMLAEIADTETVLFPAHFRGASAGRVTRHLDEYRYSFVN